MKTFDTKVEAILLSVYCDIIIEVISTHFNLSISKLVVFTYIIKKNKGIEIFSAKNSKNIVLKALSILSGDFDGMCDNMIYILKALDLLIQNGEIRLEDNQLIVSSSSKDINIVNIESNFIRKAIDASKDMSDYQFMKEVLFNV